MAQPEGDRRPGVRDRHDRLAPGHLRALRRRRRRRCAAGARGRSRRRARGRRAESLLPAHGRPVRVRVLDLPAAAPSRGGDDREAHRAAVHPVGAPRRSGSGCSTLPSAPTWRVPRLSRAGWPSGLRTTQLQARLQESAAGARTTSGSSRSGLPRRGARPLIRLLLRPRPQLPPGAAALVYKLANPARAYRDSISLRAIPEGPLPRRRECPLCALPRPRARRWAPTAFSLVTRALAAVPPQPASRTREPSTSARFGPAILHRRTAELTKECVRASLATGVR